MASGGEQIKLMVFFCIQVTMGSENEIVLLKWLTKNDYIESNGARTEENWERLRN